MPNVYVLIDGGHDYSAAEDYGTVQMLNLPASCAYDLGKAYSMLRERLESSTPDDYIVIAGPATLCCVATAIMVEAFGMVNYLLFSDGKYIPRTVVTTNASE